MKIPRQARHKIAISADQDQLSAHFGRCPEFVLFEIENGKVKNKERISNPGHHPGFLPEFLKKKGVSCIIAGSMGPRAQTLFNENQIRTIMGVSGRIDEVIQDFAAGKLIGGNSLCEPGSGKGYGIDKTSCDHGENQHT